MHNTYQTFYSCPSHILRVFFYVVFSLYECRFTFCSFQPLINFKGSEYLLISYGTCERSKKYLVFYVI